MLKYIILYIQVETGTSRYRYRIKDSYTDKAINPFSYLYV